MSYKGQFVAGDVVDFKFTTRRPSTGVPYTLAGTPAVRVYKSNSTTQSTAGVSLTVDFDAVTGLNHVRITTASDGTFYANGSQFDVVIEAGTVDGVSVVGECVGRFGLAASVNSDVTAIKAKTDNLPTDPADQSEVAALIAALPSAATVASGVWGYDLGDGRTAAYFQKGGFSKTVRTASAFTVYSTDDTTVLATAALTENGALLPLTSVDPA